MKLRNHIKSVFELNSITWFRSLSRGKRRALIGLCQKLNSIETYAGRVREDYEEVEEVRSSRSENALCKIIYVKLLQ